MKKLKARLATKLKSGAGETIAEVLIALLIAALALTMLASVITTAARVINNSKAAMNTYYQDRNGLDAGSSSLESGNVSLQISKTGETGSVVFLKEDQSSPFSVNCYRIKSSLTANTPVVAYYWP